MRNHKRGLPQLLIFKTHLTRQSYRCVFSLLLKIITKVIIKAIAIIVTLTNPKKSKYIIVNNDCSIIAPPRFPQLLL